MLCCTKLLLLRCTPDSKSHVNTQLMCPDAFLEARSCVHTHSLSSARSPPQNPTAGYKTVLFINVLMFKARSQLTAEVQISHPAHLDSLEQASLHLLNQPQFPLLRPSSTSLLPSLQHEPHQQGSCILMAAGCSDTKEGKEQLPRGRSTPLAARSSGPGLLSGG